MQAKSLLLACGAVAAASALAGCGSSQPTSSARTRSRRPRSSSVAVRGVRASVHTGNVVYEWGRYGGADPGGASGHRPGNRGWSPTYGGWYRGGPSHVVRTPTPVSGIDGTVRQVASSNSDGYALTSNGRVYAWGAGAQGELGNGTTPALSRRAAQVDFPAGVVIDRLADPMPFDGGMAIDTRGRVWAWGNDQARQFCQRRGADVDTPVLWEWGSGRYGQLGDGRRVDRPTPFRLHGPLGVRFVAVHSGGGADYAISRHGGLWAWGLNFEGELGDGSSVTMSTRPVRHPLDAAQVSSTANVVVALGHREGSAARVGHSVSRRSAAA